MQKAAANHQMSIGGPIFEHKKASAKSKMSIYGRFMKERSLKMGVKKAAIYKINKLFQCVILPNRRIKWIIAIYPPCLNIAKAADTRIFSKPFGIKLDTDELGQSKLQPKIKVSQRLTSLQGNLKLGMRKLKAS